MKSRTNILSAAVVSAAVIGSTVALTACGTTSTVTKTVAGPTVVKTVAVPGETKTVIKTVPGPTKIVTKIKDVPTPAPTEGTLLNASGTGESSTQSFTVGGSGDYVVSWTFSNNDSSGDGGDNFILNESTAGSGDDANALSLPNVIQTSGHGNTEVDGDTGTHTFSVQADQGSSWTVRVVSAP